MNSPADEPEVMRLLAIGLIAEWNNVPGDLQAAILGQAISSFHPAL